MPGPLHELASGEGGEPGVDARLLLEEALRSLRRIVVAVAAASVLVSALPADREGYVPLISVVPALLVRHVLPQRVEWGGEVVEVHVAQYHPFAGFTVLLKTALLLGVLAASPLIAREVFRVLALALGWEAARRARLLAAVGVGLFALGAAVAILVVIPFAFRVMIIVSLRVFGPYAPVAFADVEQLFSTVVLITVATGLAFEAPLIVYLLVANRVVSPEWFTGENKRYVLAASMFLGALVSPDPSGVGMILVGLAMFASIMAAARLGARRAGREPAPEHGGGGEAEGYEEPVHRHVEGHAPVAHHHDGVAGD